MPDVLYAWSVNSVTHVLAGGFFTPDGLSDSCGYSVTLDT